MIVPIIVMIIFIVLGVMLSLGKCSFLIAGFNTMDKKEKEKYDVKALCKFMGKLMFGVGFFIALDIVGDLINKPIMNKVMPFGVCGLAIFAAIYCNTNNRFQKK